MNSNLSQLHPYPFEKLAQLFLGAEPPPDKATIHWSVGEPKHPVPKFIQEAVAGNLSGLSKYPLTVGNAELREAIAGWLTRRFRLAEGTVDADRNILPVNGTREALFAIAQCVVDPKPDALVLMPNPFYQIYEGAALLAGAIPWFINLEEKNGFLPDLSEVSSAIWNRCQLMYICNPGNPAGSVMSTKLLSQIIELAHKHNFVVASDECYSELYPSEDNPPPGLLQASHEMGNENFSRCIVFHSLSKRSSVPGMRSGFVAGDAEILEKFRLFRTYHGCAMSPPFQLASTLAWRDEEHVIENRRLYREKFERVIEIVDCPQMQLQNPDGGFYLWAPTPIDDKQFARELYRQENLVVLPGSFLSRIAHGKDPGASRVRMALVAPLDECIEAAHRLKNFLENCTDDNKEEICGKTAIGNL